MKPVLYLYRSCTSCRNAEAVLNEKGVKFDTREFFKEPFGRAELKSVLVRGDMTPSELVSTRSKAYRAEGLDLRDPSDDELLDLMLDEPRLIRRPILVTDDDVHVGFNRDSYESIATTLGAD